MLKFIILGAGPAGLAFANRLLERKCSDFVILEKANEAGGLCRSKVVDDKPMDIGGGHFLDVKRPDVLAFLFRFMPQSEWNFFERNSQIDLHNMKIHHPIESNLWQLSIDYQIEYLKSIAFAGCNQNIKKPCKFTDWIEWKLGEKISRNYMLPYNMKMFGDNLEDLGTYWLNKLPNVSFEQTLKSCLEKSAHGDQPGHASFFYPKKFGYGELWLRMAKNLGEKIRYETTVRNIDFQERSVTTDEGEKLFANKIITTIPWNSVKSSSTLYSGAERDILKLKNNSIRIDYYGNSLDTDAHWIYHPDLNLSYHRSLVRHNFLPDSKGYWTETNQERDNECIRKSQFSYLNDYAYPLNTIEKPKIMRKLLSWARRHGVFGLGRWGEHEHYNSDVTVEKALNLADQLS